MSFDKKVQSFSKAESFITDFKGDRYIHGIGVLDQVGKLALSLGKRALFVRDAFPGSNVFTDAILASLKEAGIEVVDIIDGAAPNAPRSDLYRITEAIENSQPEFVVSFGGGSTIDAVKSAIMLSVLEGSIEDYFGVGLVTKKLESTGKSLIPHLAIQTAASSGAHLTKYSNITDLATGQKKLIVDNAIIPNRALFDYNVAMGAPRSLTADGALDGLSHSLEVLYSAVGKENYETVEPVALESIRLVVEYLPRTLEHPDDEEARTALGLATDLGAYSIMIGGTNGAHLTSFSLIDVMSHGRACGLLNPYYTVFFAPAITDTLRKVGKIYYDMGYMTEDPQSIDAEKLGTSVAQAMIKFEKEIGFPTSLNEIKGFSEEHIERALTAAKNPQLKMKLENMPVPMTAEMVDTYMEPILRAAQTGKLELIKTVK